MTDDDLRARLRRADPAASLPPTAPDHVSRLLGETMTSATAVAPPRNRRRFVLAAAALVLVVGVGGGWLLLRPDGSSPVTPALGTIVQLKGAPAVAAKCVEPQPAALASAADFAFAGTVTDIAENVVRLDVTRVYRGAAADEVQVAQAGGSSEQMLGSGRFEKGRKYLVASSGGSVLICGFSGEADIPGLQELYDQAF